LLLRQKSEEIKKIAFFWGYMWLMKSRKNKAHHQRFMRKEPYLISVSFIKIKHIYLRISYLANVKIS